MAQAELDMPDVNDSLLDIACQEINNMPELNNIQDDYSLLDISYQEVNNVPEENNMPELNNVPEVNYPLDMHNKQKNMILVEEQLKMGHCIYAAASVSTMSATQPNLTPSTLHLQEETSKRIIEAINGYSSSDSMITIRLVFANIENKFYDSTFWIETLRHFWKDVLKIMFIVPNNIRVIASTMIFPKIKPGYKDIVQEMSDLNYTTYYLCVECLLYSKEQFLFKVDEKKLSHREKVHGFLTLNDSILKTEVKDILDIDFKVRNMSVPGQLNKGIFEFEKFPTVLMVLNRGRPPKYPRKSVTVTMHKLCTKNFILIPPTKCLKRPRTTNAKSPTAIAATSNTIDVNINGESGNNLFLQSRISKKSKQIAILPKSSQPALPPPPNRERPQIRQICPNLKPPLPVTNAQNNSFPVTSTNTNLPTVTCTKTTSTSTQTNLLLESTTKTISTSSQTNLLLELGTQINSPTVSSPQINLPPIRSEINFPPAAKAQTYLPTLSPQTYLPSYTTSTDLPPAKSTSPLQSPSQAINHLHQFTRTYSTPSSTNLQTVQPLASMQYNTSRPFLPTHPNTNENVERIITTDRPDLTSKIGPTKDNNFCDSAASRQLFSMPSFQDHLIQSETMESMPEDNPVVPPPTEDQYTQASLSTTSTYSKCTPGNLNPVVTVRTELSDDDSSCDSAVEIYPDNALVNPLSRMKPLIPIKIEGIQSIPEGLKWKIVPATIISFKTPVLNYSQSLQVANPSFFEQCLRRNLQMAGALSGSDEWTDLTLSFGSYSHTYHCNLKASELLRIIERLTKHVDNDSGEFPRILNQPFLTNADEVLDSLMGENSDSTTALETK